MSTRRIFSAIFGLLAMAAIVVLGLPQSATAHAQFAQPASGVVAFLGVDALHEPAVYVADLGSGRVGQIDIPVTLDADLQWSPDGTMLAFTTTDGAYGLLRSLRGCFNTEALCSDVVEVFPPFEVSALRWSPEGDKLYFLTTEGLKIAPPRARASNTVSLDTVCEYGFALAGDPPYLLCAAEANGGNVRASVYEGDGENFTKLQEIGTYPSLTALDIALNGNAAIGTMEAGGDSGFSRPPTAHPAAWQAIKFTSTIWNSNPTAQRSPLWARFPTRRVTAHCATATRASCSFTTPPRSNWNTSRASPTRARSRGHRTDNMC